MTIPTSPFPIDDLLTCGKCGAKMALMPDPEAKYSCPNSCNAPFKATELNRLLIREVATAVITEGTFPYLKAAVAQAKADDPAIDPSEHLSDDQIRRLTTDADTFLAEGQVPAAAELLGTFIDRIEIQEARATVHYAMALPSGSPLAGSRRQEIDLPGSMSVQAG